MRGGPATGRVQQVSAGRGRVGPVSLLLALTLTDWPWPALLFPSPWCFPRACTHAQTFRFVGGGKAGRVKKMFSLREPKAVWALLPLAIATSSPLSRWLALCVSFCLAVVCRAETSSTSKSPKDCHRGTFFAHDICWWVSPSSSSFVSVNHSFDNRFAEPIMYRSHRWTQS